MSKVGFKSTSYLKSDSFLAGNTAYIPTSYESIQTVTVGSGGQSTISFTSIPSTFTHLQVRGIGLFSGSVGAGYFAFNGDNASGNYSVHGLNGDSANTSANNATSQNTAYFTANAGTNPNYVTSLVLDIFDYANVNKYKTTRSHYGWTSNGVTGYTEFTSNNWRSTSAITSIVFTAGNTFAQYSSFALYGIKG